jgi:hypothetical protein
MLSNNKILGFLIAVIMLLSASVYFLYGLYSNEKEERKRFSENVNSLILDRARQQEYTVKELKALYPRFDSLANKINIKTKNVTNIVETIYNYRDTTIKSTTLKVDTLKGNLSFKLDEKCYTFSGFVKKDSIFFTKTTFKDSLTTFIYKDWDKKYFFKLIKLKPFYRAAVYSQCVGDTITVTNNIKIKK